MTLSEEEQEFYSEIGRAITQWAKLEIALFSIVARMEGTVLRGERMAPGFFSIENFRSKLAYVDATIKSRYCVFRTNVTSDSGIVTGIPGNVTGAIPAS